MRGGKACAGGVPDRRVDVAHHPTRVGHAGAGAGDVRRRTREREAYAQLTAAGRC